MSFTLTVNFTLANPDPGSYRVKYWPTSNPANITTALVSNSPFIVANLPSNSYAGTIEASCGGGQYSSAVSFSATPPIDDIYLSITEIVVAGKRDVRWTISDSPGTTGPTDPSARAVPFDMKVAYTLVGTNVFNTGNTSGLVSGLEILAGAKSVQQGNQSDELTGVHTINLALKESSAPTWGAYTAVTNSAATNVNNPVTYVNDSSGVTYRINVYINNFSTNFYT